MSPKQPTVLHLFCGSGGGALGFQRAGFRSVGNIDFNVDACADVQYLTGEKATVADLTTLSPDELREICGDERPDVLFTSPPCKGFSGCLAGERVGSDKYKGMNSLAFRGIWIALEAWATPPPLVLFENVPRIQSRGSQWLDQIEALLRSYGYAVARSTHDCGELGGLAQHRQRFLMVARHMDQVPEYLRVPASKRVRAAGEVLAELPIPIPGESTAGSMHRLPRQSPLNWLRLATIPAGGDWRDLPEAIALPTRAARQNGGFGVNEWSCPSHTVVAEGSVRNTWSSIADPRLGCTPRIGVYGVLSWDEAAPTVIGHARPDNGRFTIADPRVTRDDRIDLDSQKPCHVVIRSADGTWHRPMTTLELAALQGFPTKMDGEWLQLSGRSHASWRQRIGNAVPPPTAEAIARNCRATLAAAAGEYTLSSESIWVAPQIQHGAL